MVFTHPDTCPPERGRFVQGTCNDHAAPSILKHIHPKEGDVVQTKLYIYDHMKHLSSEKRPPDRGRCCLDTYMHACGTNGVLASRFTTRHQVKTFSKKMLC